MKGLCPSSSCRSPAILLGGKKQNALESFGKGPQNESVGVIAAWGAGQAGSWEKCGFSVPFPQIAVSGKHPALERCQPQGRRFDACQGGRVQRLPWEPGGLGPDRFPPSAACVEGLGVVGLGWASDPAVPPTVQLFALVHRAPGVESLRTHTELSEQAGLRPQLGKHVCEQGQPVRARRCQRGGEGWYRAASGGQGPAASPPSREPSPSRSGGEPEPNVFTA